MKGRTLGHRPELVVAWEAVHIHLVIAVVLISFLATYGNLLWRTENPFVAGILADLVSSFDVMHNAAYDGSTHQAYGDLDLRRGHEPLKS